jgi:hypothetical protein
MTSACSSPIRFSLNKPDPLNVGVLPGCYDDADLAACDEKALPITKDPDSAVRSAQHEHELRRTCGANGKMSELRRQACVQALKRGIDAGAIK